MKRKELIYLDTSVPSAYYDERSPERQKLTKYFWKKIDTFDVFVSDVTIKELEQTLNPEKKKKLLELAGNYKILFRTPESDNLAAKYITEKIIPENYLPDAYHLAIASVNNINYLISWNFDHLVNVKTRQMVNLVNLREGYSTIEIIPPPELVS